MVINDNEHMSNHPAIFWPVSAKSGNSIKKGQKWQLELKSKFYLIKSAQNMYEHEPHECQQKSHPNHATSAKKRAKMPIFPFLPPNCALISDFFAGNFFDFCCFQNLLKTLNL